MMTVNGIIDYRSPSYDNDSSCWLRVFELPDRVAVVVATELAENKGASVTNTAEALAKMVAELYDLDPVRTYFVEHYDRRGDGLRESNRGMPDETYDFVEFDWHKDDAELGVWYAARPRWHHGSKEEVEKLIGEKLAPVGASY